MRGHFQDNAGLKSPLHHFFFFAKPNLCHFIVLKTCEKTQHLSFMTELIKWQDLLEKGKKMRFQQVQ